MQKQPPGTVQLDCHKYVLIFMRINSNVMWTWFTKYIQIFYVLDIHTLPQLRAKTGFTQTRIQCSVLHQQSPKKIFSCDRILVKVFFVVQSRDPTMLVLCLRGFFSVYGALGAPFRGTYTYPPQTSPILVDGDIVIPASYVGRGYEE